MTGQQLNLFDAAVKRIHCVKCVAELSSLDDLRLPCPGGDIHQVTTSDYFVLYSKTYPVVLA